MIEGLNQTELAKLVSELKKIGYKVDEPKENFAYKGHILNKCLIDNSVSFDGLTKGHADQLKKSFYDIADVLTMNFRLRLYERKVIESTINIVKVIKDFHKNTNVKNEDVDDYSNILNSLIQLVSPFLEECRKKTSEMVSKADEYGAEVEMKYPGNVFNSPIKMYENIDQEYITEEVERGE